MPNHRLRDGDETIRRQLSLPETLWSAIQAYADAEGISASEWIRRRIADYLRREDLAGERRDKDSA